MRIHLLVATGPDLRVGPYPALVSPLPDGVSLHGVADATTDLAHIFLTRRDELEGILAGLRASLRPAVPVWVSWPKRAARVPTDVTEDVIRAVALPMGYVDVKVCAVDATWSGLKLVVRVANR
jgi:hypothetical protein